MRWISCRGGRKAPVNSEENGKVNWWKSLFPSLEMIFSPGVDYIISHLNAVGFALTCVGFSGLGFWGVISGGFFQGPSPRTSTVIVSMLRRCWHLNSDSAIYLSNSEYKDNHDNEVFIEFRHVCFYVMAEFTIHIWQWSFIKHLCTWTETMFRQSHIFSVNQENVSQKKQPVQFSCFMYVVRSFIWKTLTM